MQFAGHFLTINRLAIPRVRRQPPARALPLRGQDGPLLLLVSSVYEILSNSPPALSRELTASLGNLGIFEN